MHLDDAAVLVTGASGGIGAAVARSLAKRGARLMLHGRDTDRLHELAGEIGGAALPVDLLDVDGPEKLAALAAANSDGRGLDAVVHCAGVGWRGAIGEMSVEDADRLITLNLRAPVQITRAVLPAMIARGGGHLCFVASVAGLTGVADEAVYSATKGGLLAFADSVRLEVTGSGVTVSTVSPGPVRTGFFDARGAGYHRRFPRMLAPETVAECVVRCIANDRANAVRPRWLAVAPLAQAVAPGAYRRLAARFG